MRSIVTDAMDDYIFATDFDVLASHLDNLINQACRTPTPTISPPETTLPFCPPDDVTGPTPPPGGNTRT